MRNKIPYNPLYLLRRMFLNILLSIGLLVFILLLSMQNASASNEIIEIELSPIVSFDYVPVDFIVTGYLKFETDVVITESNKVYISIEELFKNLGIKCISENEGDKLAGFIENENKTYLIDYQAKQIILGNRTIKSANGFLKESGNVYVESTVITEAFGLNLIFNYRSLSVKLEANFELPFVKKMRIEKMRQNISKLQNREIIADTVVKRDYHLFKFGMIDWSTESYQIINESSRNRLRLGVGTEMLYGQTNVSMYYDDRFEFTNRNLHYDWRWVDNDNYIIKQAQLGKISNQSIAYINSPVVGATFNNSPTTVRKASGFYNINDYTEPNWSVELYINDILVDYTIADASGLYVFKVPIVYGYTILKLKFYGPLGEERIEERTMNIPFTFMQPKTFEYNVSGGVLEDGKNSGFGRGDFDYGVNRFMTIGGGVEYLSSIINSPFIPFAKIAFQPFSKLVFNLEYAHDVRMKGLLNYNFRNNVFLELDYTTYTEGQKAVRFKPDEELKVRLSAPFRMNKISGFAKLNYNQNAYGEFKYNQMDAVFSGYYKNYSANLATRLNWLDKNDIYSTTKLALSYRTKNGFVFRPMAEYNLSNNKFFRYKIEFEKRVSKASFSISYERNIEYKTDNVLINFKYDLPFARTGMSASYYNDKYYLSESAQGSIAMGGNTTVKTGNNTSLGKGGILFFPYLDLNQNGKKDNGEQMILLSKVKVTGGKANISEKDSIVRVSDLNAFINYNLEFSDADLENINWRFKHKTYQILVDPNQYKSVDIPIIALGEISGKVYLNNNMDGIGRITIEIYDNQGNKVAQTLSENNGYFSYLGLKQGKYTIKIDETQMKTLGFECNPCTQTVEIKNSFDGDIIEGLKFKLNKVNN